MRIANNVIGLIDNKALFIFVNQENVRSAKN